MNSENQIGGKVVMMVAAIALTCFVLSSFKSDQIINPITADTPAKKMYIVLLTYKRPLSEIDRYGTEHVAFLDRYFQAGKFIVSGRQNPRTGGVIVAHKVTKEELEEILKEDPFHQHQLADYQITEFIPVKYAQEFKFFIDQ